MASETEAQFKKIAQLLDSMPSLSDNIDSKDTQLWLARAYATTAEVNSAIAVELKVATDLLLSTKGYEHIRGRQLLPQILYRAFAVAESRAPSGVQGAFIPAGNAFDTINAFSKVLGAAQHGVFAIDPYMDEKVLTDFAPLVGENVSLRLLADQASHKPSLRPAAVRWTTQYGSQRPLEAKVTAPRLLHDRLVILDGKDVWILTQSFKDFATRSPASIAKLDSDTAALKVAAYEQIWTQASHL